MKRFALVLALSVAAAGHATAQTVDEDGPSLMERGAQLFFRGLMSEMEPALDDLRGLADDVAPALRSFAREMGPALADLLQEIRDFSVYHPPEIMPNGDIIMRKKTPEELDAPDPDAPDAPEGEIET